MTMVKIYVDNEALDLPASFALDIEDSSPIFNDRGSQSVPVAVPVTPRNSRLLGFPQHLYTAKDPNKGTLASVTCGIYGRTGSLNITEGGPGTISFNIGFDNSVAYQKWAAKSLADLTLPVRTYTDVNAAILSMSVLYRNSDPAHNDLAVFPVLLAKEDVDGVSYPTAVNIPSGSAFFNPGEIKAVVDGTVKDVTVPAGYGISPFLRVWRLVELVFADLGLTVRSNPMKSDRELARLVVLNNTMDTICGAKVDYRDLVPDCSVEEFMNALWVRFGLVYNIDWTKGIVEIRLLDDILKSRPVTSLDEYMAQRPSVTYDSPRMLSFRRRPQSRVPSLIQNVSRIFPVAQIRIIYRQAATSQPGSMILIQTAGMAMCVMTILTMPTSRRSQTPTSLKFRIQRMTHTVTATGWMPANGIGTVWTMPALMLRPRPRQSRAVTAIWPVSS